jgi:hypothetical protein
MESFSYVNIFETKGLEYLVIIGFLAILLPFVRHLHYSDKKTPLKKTPK